VRLRVGGNFIPWIIDSLRQADVVSQLRKRDCYMDIQLTSLDACALFLESQPPSVVAARLLQDQSVCRTGKGIPSLLAYCLPARADAIAREISNDVPGVPIAVARMRYASIVANIKSYITNLERDALDGDSSTIPAHMMPSDDDYRAALKVLRYLQLPQTKINIDCVDQMAAIVQSQLELGPHLRHALLTDTKKSRICYICRFRITQAHRLYPSLCHPCGEFCMSSSAISLPSNLDLHSKTAVVTGGRVNLGFHTALRLLRCGARVIVSTRYPCDALERYRNEHDAEQWISRLRIMGADFRTAKDVFALVKAILGCLHEWGTSKLDILINNAAQTLTDSIEREERQIQREWLLMSADSGEDRLVQDNDTDYTPRLRGGQSDRLLIENNNVPNPERQSSWVQRMSEIPYEDIISAHSVNTFVPFILIRELMPYMRRDSEASPIDDASPKKPSAYIVNVTSREGLPERRQAKNGQHVHTNMSKAALNMLTETEAGKAWKEGRVALNAVDPGYMSAPPEWMRMIGREGEETPLNWEDGVGRVLWVVAKGKRRTLPFGANS
jgi:NAD(P)-dependent dehydrogenase (short-subunit alcohol dehydrogenase family)